MKKRAKLREENFLMLLKNLNFFCTEVGDCDFCPHHFNRPVNGHYCKFTAVSEEINCSPSEWNMERIRRILNKRSGNDESD